MENISLIANSGIQFYTFDFIVDSSAEVAKSVRFYEWFDKANFKVKLEYAHYLSAEDVWVSKRELLENGFFDDNGKLSDNINLNILKRLSTETDCFSINDIDSGLKLYNNKWMPLPFFEYNNAGHSLFGPTNWARIKMNFIEKNGSISKYKAVIAIDTNVPEKKLNEETPFFYGNDDYNTYKLCEDLDLVLDFCKEEWIDTYVKGLFLNGGNKIPEFPQFKYIAQYIFFIHYLQKSNQLPKIKLFSDKVDSFINIDFVLDIGNSRTCGLLFDSSDIQNPFSKVKMLQIQDLSTGFLKYEDPFSMRLAFHKAEFGDIDVTGSRQFIWPSILRVGVEANNLIYLSQNKNTDAKQKINNHSSPKRYLWDDEVSKHEWEFIELDGTNPIKSIYLEGISQQFNNDGSFNSTTDFGVSSSYSKKSLMTFVFIEILVHAHVQINSYKFRDAHGVMSSPRKIKRIIVTCPTGMVQSEQIALRESAEEAAIIIHRFFKNTYAQPFQKENSDFKIDIVPAIKDLKRNLQNQEDKTDWIYDEATCNQLVFIYAEISKRYKNKCEKYFDIYGKFRKDLSGYNKKSITIGSVDIGAGTTDLMIGVYKYDDEGKAVLTPVPIYWESFNYAGDDLLKEIIIQVIIEGDIKDEKFRGCTGVIYNTLIEKGISSPENKLLTFFGENSTKIEFYAQQIRRDFNVQISIPVALKFLELARSGSEDMILTYDDLFPMHFPQPNQTILDYFENHFGLDFKKLRWKFSLERINIIIENVFEPLIKRLSALLYSHGCDFVLISGKPTSIKRVEDLFSKHYSISPDRLVTLNKYRIGSWYPFSDGSGYFDDQKSLVAVGAMIALLGGKLDRLSNFRFNFDELKNKLISNAYYFGFYDTITRNVADVFLTPEVNQNKIRVAGFPISIGSKRLKTDTYPGKMTYILAFNEKYIVENIKQNKNVRTDDFETLEEEKERFITNLKKLTPFTFKLIRDYRTDRERIFIDSVNDVNGEEVSAKFFKLKPKTLSDENGYWLDNGVFLLKIKEK